MTQTGQSGVFPASPGATRQIWFDRRELDLILWAYGKLVAEGECRDYQDSNQGIENKSGGAAARFFGFSVSWRMSASRCRSSSRSWEFRIRPRVGIDSTRGKLIHEMIRFRRVSNSGFIQTQLATPT